MIAASDVRAGAFTPAQGSWEVIASGSFTRGDHYYDGDGALVRGPLYRKAELPITIEYGYRDDLTLIFAPKLLSIEAGAFPASSYDGLGGVLLGARYRLLDDGVNVFSTQASARFGGALMGQRNRATIGETDNQITAALLYARRFVLPDMLGGFPAFAGIDVGYRARASLADEIILDMTLGVQLTPSWLLLLQSFNRIVLGSQTSLYTGLDVWGRANKVQLSLLYELAPGWQVQFGLLASYSGINAWQERGAMVAVIRKF